MSLRWHYPNQVRSGQHSPLSARFNQAPFFDKIIQPPCAVVKIKLFTAASPYPYRFAVKTRQPLKSDGSRKTRCTPKAATGARTQYKMRGVGDKPCFSAGASPKHENHGLFPAHLKALLSCRSAFPSPDCGESPPVLRVPSARC